MVEALNYVSPGIANDHPLFYGVEAKFGLPGKSLKQ